MAQSAATELLTYTNTDYGFTLQYPPDWTIYDSNIKNAGLILRPPDTTGRVTVLVDAIPYESIEIAKTMTLDELIKSFALPVGALSLPQNELVSFGVNIIELNAEGYYLSGHPAGRIVMTVGDLNMTKIMGLATIINDKAYAALYSADMNKYNDYL